YTDAIGNSGLASNTIKMTGDTLVPSLIVSSDKTSLKAGETATLTFIFSELPVGFDSSDISVTGGTLGTLNGTGLTRTVVFTPTANINTLTANISVAASTYTDAIGNNSLASLPLNLTGDTLVPSLIVSSDKTSLKAGETATLTFLFSESPFGFDSSDINVTGGTLGTLNGTGLSRTAVFTPTADTNTLIASINVAASTYSDAIGNNGLASNTLNLTGDALAPSLTISSDKTSLKAGDTATLTFLFSELPIGFDASDINVTGGTLGTLNGTGLTRTAVFTPTANTDTLTASINVAASTYTVAIGNNGLASNTLTLTGDTLAPSLTISSDRSSFQAGDTATLTFNFSELPTGFDSSDISVTGGTLGALNGTGLTRTAAFTPSNNSYLTAKISVVANHFTDNAGNNNPVSNTLNLSVDTRPPYVYVYGYYPNSSSTPVISEGNSGTRYATFQIYLSKTYYQTVTVNYQTADGTATAGSDYTAISGQMSFAPGENSKTVNVPILGDTLFEPNETMQVSLSAPQNAMIGSSSVLTINNDDSQYPTSTAPIDQAVIDLGSQYGQLIQPVNVDGHWYYYWDRSGDGTMLNTQGAGYTNYSDYATHDVLDAIFNQDINGTVGGGGNTTDTYRYATLNGVRVALPRTGSTTGLNYGYQSATTLGGSPATAGSTAINPTYDDLLAIWDAYNGTGTGTSYNGTPPGWATYSYYWSATPSVSGHAYVSYYGYVSNDFDYYSYSVALEVLPTTHVLTISGASSAEGDSGTSMVNLTVSLSTASNHTASVSYATLDGTATAGSDYTAVSGTLSFAPGETSKTVSIPVLGDTTVENNETFQVQLSNAANALLSTTNSTATVTITNDDLPAVSIASTAVSEGNSGSKTANITVSLSVATNQTVTVNYQAADGTATAGSDYTATSGQLSFAPGETSKTLGVNLLGDTVYETNETVQVSLFNPQNATLGTSSAVLTINNDDTLSVTGQAVIDLGGTYGTLIQPVNVDGHWYYFWDRSGDGVSGSSDQTSHDVLDGIFNQDSNGTVGGGGNTTDTYRYATLNNVRLALPRVGDGITGINSLYFVHGTAIGGSPASAGSTATNPTYNDLLAIWDGYNGTATGTQDSGVPSGWGSDSSYWSATPSVSGHAYVSLSGAYVLDIVDALNSYVALEVM
ncbi:MAG: Ig-like domain-containing protein, partial [Methylococcaceae bacterium]